jgi:hypothetical protein
MRAQPRYLSRAAHGGIPDDIVRELCSRLFASLPRNDQRRKGEQYVRGLLCAHGRKSIRNIATVFGGRAVEQSLHHFINDSTWDWRPVRESLAGYLEAVAQPRAWVVRPMVIPKAGKKSVGVDRRFVSELGQVVNSQQAFGGWLASEELSVPVNWQLVVSGARRGGPERRPDAVAAAENVAASGEWACGAALDLAAGRPLGGRPVVMDVGDVDVGAMVRRFAGAGVPLLLRIGPATRLTADDPAVPWNAGREVPAYRMVDVVKTLRRPVEWLDPSSQALRTSFVASVQVRAPWPGGGGDTAGPRPALRLLGEWEDPRRWPTSCWLTDLAESPASLLRLTQLTRRVEQDFAEVSEHVGIRDFEGRSFEGWHRHATLASAAHTASVLATAGAPAAAAVHDRLS